MRRVRPWIALVVCALTTSAAWSSQQTGWPGLRGPDSDGSARQATLFPGNNAGLAVTWKIPIGSGYSAIVAAGNRVYTMHVDGEQDALSAFDAGTGERVWSYPIAPTHPGHDGSHDGPISTPLLAGERVFGLGPRGHLFAVDVSSGAPLWTKNLVEDLHARAPYYGFTTSPVLLDGVLVVEVGIEEDGKSIAGFDPATGELLWTAGTDTIEYQTPIVAAIGGRRMVVAAGTKKVFGIDASSGTVLWEFEHGGDDRAMGGASIVPVPAGDGRFLLVNKIDASTMIQVAVAEGAYSVSAVWSSNAIRGTYVIPVYRDGYLYGISGRIFTCVDAATGETVWRSREPGDGFPTLVGDKLVVITKPGSLHVAQASAEGFQEVASLALFDEHSWSQVAFADGHLYARSMKHIARIDPVEVAVPAPQRATWLASTEFGHFLTEVDRADDKAAVIDAYLARQTSFPIVEGPDTVHFVFRGEAEDVGIVGDVIGFRREDPMTRVDGTDLFYYSMRVEPDAAAAYGFIRDYGEPTADPLNPRKADGLFGEVSLFSMPAWQGPADAAGPASAPRGRLEDVEWKSELKEGQTRRARVYLPPGYDAQRRFPVLYVHDGKSALEEGRMDATLDRMVGVTIEPLIAVFILPDEENPERDMRPMETYVKMVLEELVPLIDARYATLSAPAGRAVAGAGEGADAAMMCAFEKSGLFSRLGAQSGFLGPAELDPLVPSADERPMTLYFAWGTYHMRSPHEAWDLAEENRNAWALLRERGYRPAGGEVPEGYGWAFWSAHVDELLTALFPLPTGASKPGAAALQTGS